MSGQLSQSSESPKTAGGHLGVRLLDVKQVAEMLNVSASWIREHAAGKEPALPAMKFGTGKTCVVRFHPADIEEFVMTQRQRAKVRKSMGQWRN